MFIISMACIGLAAFSPFYFYFRYKGYGDYTGLAALGPVGDFVGGTTVTFFTAASVFLLIATNIMQREELKASEAQAKEVRKEAKITNETMKRQQFETTFFNMLQLHHQIVENIQLNRRKEDFRGRKAIEEIKDIFEDSLGAKQYFVENPEKGINSWLVNFQIRKRFLEKFLNTPNGISKEMLNEVYEEFHDEHGNAIGHYMRNNYRIVKFIVENVVEDENEQKRIKKEEKRDTIVGDKRFYFGTLRAQWSNAEFELIFINSLYEKNSKFKKLIKKYDVLDIRETKEEKLKGKPEGCFLLKANTIIYPAYNSLIEND
ncbi:putative phage abortive infection protein [Bacillus toyonensis]|nr:putative phage abortive infection protein [Bacillus toyonensis]